jgi:hypothetical protein
MNPRRTLLHKVLYLAAMAGLLAVIAVLALPSSGEPGNPNRRPGGYLTQLRDRYGLSESLIGQLDPTSQTIRLATLGMRGVAANILWEKANDYKMKKDWSNLKATLNQLIRLEPHFVTVWRHQGWNLSYNVSAEFDDYRGRYHWVIEGIRFLQEGIHYNEHSPHLVWDVGWFIGQKIGRADEHKQFRRLFREDEDFHQDRPPEYRDNWLVGKEWFRTAEGLVARGDSLKNTSPVLFYSDAPMCQANYADALEIDGVFQEKAKRAWQKFDYEWTGGRRGPYTEAAPDLQAAGGDILALGAREIRTTTDELIRLNEQETLLHAASDNLARLKAIEPDLFQKLLNEKRKDLSPKERKALDTAPADLTGELFAFRRSAMGKLDIRPEELARRVKDDKKRDEARTLATQINLANHMADVIGRYKQIVNFDYWRSRAIIEQSDEAVTAREFFYKGESLAKLDPQAAQEEFVKGFVKWRAAVDRFPQLKENGGLGQPVIDAMERYVKVLDQLDEVFPKDFALADYIRSQVDENHGAFQARGSMAEGRKAEAKGDLRAARKAYETALSSWRGVLDKLPAVVMMADPKTSAELLELVTRYAAIAEKLGETVGQDFPLLDFVRVQIQHADGTDKARELVFSADRAREEQRLPEARKQYEAGLAAWRKVLDQFPKPIRTCDSKILSRLNDVIEHYRFTMRGLGQKFPQPFVLQDVSDAIRAGGMSVRPRAPKPARPPIPAGVPGKLPGGPPSPAK